MLLVIGILALVGAFVVFALSAWASGMSDAPGSEVAYWPSVCLILLAIGCFVARHFLHGMSITW